MRHSGRRLPAGANTTFTVTSAADTAGSTCGSGCTLRQAINAANATGGPDSIRFALAGSSAIDLGAELPAVGDPAGLTIDGAGSTDVTINGGDSVRVISVNQGAELALADLTIENGSAGANNGGAIFNQAGTLTGCMTPPFFREHDGRERRCSLQQRWRGDRDRFHLLGQHGGLGRGGRHDTRRRHARCDELDVRGQRRGVGRGHSEHGRRRAHRGLLDHLRTVQTREGAGASSMTSPPGRRPCGPRSWRGALRGQGGSCSGTIADGGYDIDDGTTCGFSSANHSLSNANPRLDPHGLQSNGGPTQTVAVLAASPAVDAIPPGAIGCGTDITTDQRGQHRPQGPRWRGGALN